MANKVKFTAAGFPMHDYLKEQREEKARAMQRRPNTLKGIQTQNDHGNPALQQRLHEEKLNEQINIVDTINREL